MLIDNFFFSIAIFKEVQWKIENIAMITIKHLQMNQILALNNL